MVKTAGSGINTLMRSSVNWMAPEIGEATRKGVSPTYDGKYDIWNLGCVVLEMWVGRRSWQDVSLLEVCYSTKTDCPLAWTDIY